MAFGLSVNRSVAALVLTPVLAAGFAGLTAGCGKEGGGSTLLVADGVRREMPPANPPVQAVVEGLTTFGYELYGAVAETGKNVVLSPLCVGYAFAMARAGANGETAAQIDKVFGFPANGVHSAFNAVSRQIVTVDGPPPAAPAKREVGQSAPPVVTIANGLFLQRDLPVKEPFLRTLAAQYGAGVRTVDFTAGDSASNAIDEWARQQTADRIKKVFDNLDPATRLVLANAVYFRADWKEQLLNVTEEQMFTRADATTVRTAMMSNTMVLRYAAGHGWQAVELPYAGDAFVMWVLVPTGSDTSSDTSGAATGPATPDRLLSPQTLSTVADKLTATSVEVSIPRWDFETRPDLVGALARLGLIAPFNFSADFSGIADGLFIGQAMHAANITVDEWGTEAAAIAAIAMPASGPPPAEVIVRADRPFAFAIMHVPTRTPLFIGRVADPTAT